MDSSRGSTSSSCRAAALVDKIRPRRERLLRELARRSPQAKWAAGVYYTPPYIVDYMVRNAVGPLVADTGPRRPDLPRILDPACGAGSFLIGAYRHLLDYLLDWRLRCYLENAAEYTRGPCPYLRRDRDGNWHLTASERQRTLLDGIFGVDLDPQAVEAAKLSLVLQMLDGTAEEDDAIAAETLDRLADNIRCSDVLVGADVAGEFSAVVGNPPYRRERGSKALLESLAGTRFGDKYRSARMDLWYYFLHRGLELLRPGGVLSFIVSAYWAAGSGAEKLVAALRDEAHLDEVFLLEDLPIFPKVAGRHTILRATKRPRRMGFQPILDGKMGFPPVLDGLESHPTNELPTTIKRVPPRCAASAEDVVGGKQPVIVYKKTARQLFRASGIDLEPPADELLAKIGRWPGLGALGLVRQGIAENPAAINARTNAAFGNRWRIGEGVFALRQEELKSLALSADECALVRPYYDLCDVARYGIAEHPSLRLLYLTKNTCPDIGRYPRLKAHLARFRPIMEARRETRQGSNRWWHLHWPRDARIWESPKILCPQFGRRPAFAPVSQAAYAPFSINVFVPSGDTPESLAFLCGLLNSRMLWKWYLHCAKRRGVGLEINGRVLARTPIRRIDFSKPDDRERHDQIAALARTMLALTQQRAACTATEKAGLCEQLETTDRRLDRLVYGLYGLTDEEIAQIETATGSKS